MGRFMTWGWYLILPGCGGTSTLARGTTHAARWLYKTQSISNQWVGMGFPYLAGRYRPGGSLLSSPVLLSCIYMEGFFTTQGWDIILPGCGGTSTLARGGNLASRWLYKPQPISNQRMGVGLSYRAGGIDPRGHFYCPGLLELYMQGRVFDQGMGLYPPRMRRGPDAGPRGNSRSALAP